MASMTVVIILLVQKDVKKCYQKEQTSLVTFFQHDIPYLLRLSNLKLQQTYGHAKRIVNIDSVCDVYSIVILHEVYQR